eukprot:4010662-Pyramimonas_sp.AAC.1
MALLFLVICMPSVTIRNTILLDTSPLRPWSARRAHSGSICLLAYRAAKKRGRARPKKQEQFGSKPTCSLPRTRLGIMLGL